MGRWGRSAPPPHNHLRGARSRPTHGIPTQPAIRPGDIKVSDIQIGPDEQGATALEYAIVASLIAAVIVTVVALLGTDVVALFQGMVDAWI